MSIPIHMFKKNDSDFVLLPLKRWEVNTYLVDNLRQPPGPSQTKHQQIHNYPFETDDFVELQIRNSFFRRYAIFFIKLNGFVIFILVWIFRKWKQIVFFIWFNLWYKPKWNMCVCILVRIKWADFPFDIFFVNYKGLNSRYWYMNWTQIICKYCVKLMKIYAINKWILFLVYHFVIAPVHLSTIWMNFIYY